MENIFSYQMNSFAPTSEIKGRLDLDVNLNNFAGIVDESQDTPLLPGDPVSIVGTSSGLPHYAKAAAGGVVFGYVKWSAKQSNYPAGSMVEVASGGDVMYMEAGAQTNAGVALNITDFSNFYVGAKASSGSVIGYALESASAANELIRVLIVAPVTQAANG